MGFARESTEKSPESAEDGLPSLMVVRKQFQYALLTLLILVVYLILGDALHGQGSEKNDGPEGVDDPV